MDYYVAVDVGVLCVGVGESLAVPLADSTTATPVGAVSLLEGIVMVFFHISHKSPGENLVPAFGRAAAALRVVSSLGRRFGETVGYDIVCRQGWGPAPFPIRQHTVFLRDGWTLLPSLKLSKDQSQVNHPDIP
uniref:Uncharacterized protein n=1 Tax=Oryza punctata TaxID=4537 RepID=A0A0E0MMV6_ORYPU